MTTKLIGYSFVSHVQQDARPEIDVDFSEIYKHKCHSFLNTLHREACIRLGGYRYDAHRFLRRYVVKQYGSWNEYYAPNKTLLRRSLYGRIDRIFELV